MMIFRSPNLLLELIFDGGSPINEEARRHVGKGVANGGVSG
jgi:hypothetical protein